MKGLRIVGFLLTSVFAVNAQVLTLKISTSGLEINNQLVKLPIAENSLRTILGNPDRTTNKANLISTWDKLGVIAYQSIAGEKFSEIAIILDVKQNKFDFTPAQAFSGNLFVDGAAVMASSTRSSINATKTGAKFKPIVVAPFLSELTSGKNCLTMLQDERGKVSSLGKVQQISVTACEKK